ncbi:rRNA maturation RNase YbeY [Ethanoligenens sp.]|uniref:rRNA maturation RNase YbeY n=1 Tax=Ethanoligenens sp. TaxID=2099655 RepID=UPI0039E75C77
MDKLKVYIDNRQKSVKIPSGLRLLVRRCCNATLANEGFDGSAEVNVTFVDDVQIQELNAQYRHKDTPTDVLSFPMGENGKFDLNPDTGAYVLGDVVISLETASLQAEKYGHSLQQEVAFLTVHSILHIMGHDHEQGGIQAVHMHEHEAVIMAALGFNHDLYEEG